ncbi:MAG: hypothetical protein EOP76_09575 [Variovorax sp.]|nr:MAG: hypothetical protein EOP76_09575 [Variovorax sp.]
MAEKNSVEAVKEALGKPVLMEFSEATAKIRLNLMIAALITIAVVMLDVKVSPTNTLLGVTFEGLTTQNLKTGFLLVNVYMFIHFFWCAADSVQEWRLRITGTKVAFLTGAAWGTEGTDHPADPRQSTLYNWWLDQTRRFKDIDGAIVRMKDAIDALAAAVSPPSGPIAPELFAVSQLHSIKSDMQTLGQQLDAVRTTIESKRIPVSLERFDAAFSLFLRSQNLRWLVVEAGFPLLLGVCSIFLLCRERFL